MGKKIPLGVEPSNLSDETSRRISEDSNKISNNINYAKRKIGYDAVGDSAFIASDDYSLEDDMYEMIDNDGFFGSQDTNESIAYHTVKTKYENYHQDVVRERIIDNMSKLAEEMIKRLAQAGAPYHIVEKSVTCMMEEIYVAISIPQATRGTYNDKSKYASSMSYLRGYLETSKDEDPLSHLLANDYAFNLSFKNLAVDGSYQDNIKINMELPDKFLLEHESTEIGQVIKNNMLENSVRNMNNSSVSGVFINSVDNKPNLVSRIKAMVIGNYFGVQNINRMNQMGAGASVGLFFNRIMSDESQEINSRLSNIITDGLGGMMRNNNNNNMFSRPGQQQYPQQNNMLNNNQMGGQQQQQPVYNQNQQNDPRYQALVPQNQNNQMMQQSQMNDPNAFMNLEIGHFRLDKNGVSASAMNAQFDRNGNILNAEGITTKQNQQQLGNNNHGMLGGPNQQHHQPPQNGFSNYNQPQNYQQQPQDNETEDKYYGDEEEWGILDTVVKNKNKGTSSKGGTIKNVTNHHDNLEEDIEGDFNNLD